MRNQALSCRKRALSRDCQPSADIGRALVGERAGGLRQGRAGQGPMSKGFRRTICAVVRGRTGQTWGEMGRRGLREQPAPGEGEVGAEFSHVAVKGSLHQAADLTGWFHGGFLSSLCHRKGGPTFSQDGPAKPSQSQQPGLCPPALSKEPSHPVSHAQLTHCHTGATSQHQTRPRSPRWARETQHGLFGEQHSDLPSSSQTSSARVTGFSLAAARPTRGQA